MNKDIKYTGVTSVPSEYECQDGELSFSMNLINENGSLTSIQQPAVEMEMPEGGKYKVVFIHKTSAFRHYIFYNEEDKFLYWSSNDRNLSQIDYFYDFNHCNAVGNTLIVFTKSKMTYILWQEEKAYSILGEELPTINVSFGLYGHPRLYSNSSKHNEKFTVEFAERIEERNIRFPLSEANKTRITEQVMAKLNMFIREETVDRGRFCFPFLVRYALRLYDGSLVCHSSPILMNPSTTPSPVVLWGRIRGNSSYEKAEGCDIMLVSAGLDYRIEDNGYTLLDKWKDIIKSIDVFVSKPIYTYDQSGQIDSFFDTDNYTSEFIGVLPNYSRGGEKGDKVLDNVRRIGNIPLFYKETIKEVKDMGSYLQWKYSQIYKMYFNQNIPGETIHLPEFNSDKVHDQISSCNVFYKLHTIDFQDNEDVQRRIFRQSIPVSNDYLQSLTSREVMTDDYLTHDRLIPSSSYVYNSRLNLTGIRRELFPGFSPISQFAYCNRTLGTFEEVDGEIHVAASEATDKIRIDTYIREGGAKYIVTVESSELAPWMSRKILINGKDAREKRSWGAYLFYPNTNAYRMVITSNYGGNETGMYDSGGQYTVNLLPHDFLNGSYALLDYNIERLPNIEVDAEKPIPPGTGTVNSSSIVENGNKIYTSEVNNPFYFPLSGINTVGTGRVLGMSTAAKALSEGQFGQYPLYAFTEDGVWAMEVSATGTYSAKQPITRDVCTNTEGITQIDSAVLFPTHRGIMIISGSQTMCISEPINDEAPFDILRLPYMDKLYSMIGHDADKSLPVRPFSDFLKGCKMIYDYTHQRIVIYNREYSYAYVYSLKTKLWGMCYSDIVDNVNSYPDALAVTASGKLVNFAKSDGFFLSGLFVTRPLKFDASGILKMVDSVIQRGNFARGHVSTVLYGSRDLINWYLVWSSRDHYLRGFRGTPYKFFRVAGVANLNADESIVGASVQFTPRLTNQPR